jgi:3-oxoacyl-[acyl-carrier protein] reductase
MINPGLRDRTVLITGANNPLNIGAAIAVAFAGVGAKPFFHYQRVPEPISAADGVSEAFYRAQQAKDCGDALRQVAAAGADARAFEADFSDPSAVGRLFEQAERSCGPIDALINSNSVTTERTG